MKIFLGDLVHTWEKVSLWTFPLNIGYIGAYAKKHIADNIDIRLFKRPEIMIEAIKDEKPDVVGLTYYVWNANLNRVIFDVAKAHIPDVLTVGGGPMFTRVNSTPEHARPFFAKTESLDVYVFNQGERGFVELLGRFLEVGCDVSALRAEPVSGCMIRGLGEDGQIHVGTSLSVIRDMDEIPSPYLNGMMDEFFDDLFVPIIETNRSCPYRCTFCAWGIGTDKLSKFSDERVFAEIDYIAKRCTKSINMFVADANFSILDRDAEIAKRMHDRHVETGYPGHVVVQWNKTRPDRVLNTAKEFKGISEVGASMQTLSLSVLKAIKRRNLPLETVAAIVRDLASEDFEATLFTELIVGLPEETWQSHIDANKTLIDLGAEVFNYNLHLLPGTEMDTVESRTKYFKRTGWRIHDNAFGVYDGVKVFEGQEVVIETSSMSMDELRSFRFIHFLIQFMWSRKWYYDFLHLFKHADIHPVDMIVRIADAFKRDEGEMGELHGRFTADHDLESFDIFGDMAEYWGRDENLERLKSGSYGKLNYLFTYDILLDHYDGFNEFLYRVAEDAAKETEVADIDTFLEQCRDVLGFTRELRINFTKSLDSVVDSKRRSFGFDLLSWREGGYAGRLERNGNGEKCEYEFFLPERQKTVLERQLSQFRSHNVNLTLRKMSEEISANDFFYQVRSASGATAPAS